MKVLEIAAYLHSIGVEFELYGDEHEQITGYSSLYRCRPGTIVWARDHATFLGRNNAVPEVFSLLLTNYDNPETEGIAAKIMTDDPRSAFFQIIDHFWPSPIEQGIADSAVIRNGAQIGRNVVIGEGCVISAQTVIGDGTQLGHHVITIGSVKIGRGCKIQSGCVIGENGMALVKDNQFIQPIPHYGGVDIGNRVYIGANCCICRGTIEDTVICDDVKIDALCHISHNCVLAERTLLMAGSVLLGGVEVGKDCVINSALIKDQKALGNHVIVSHGAVVTRKLPDNVVVQGPPVSIQERF